MAYSSGGFTDLTGDNMYGVVNLPYMLSVYSIELNLAFLRDTGICIDPFG